MYLFCVRRCRRPGAAADVNFFSFLFGRSVNLVEFQSQVRKKSKSDKSNVSAALLFCDLKPYLYHFCDLKP
eukprot:UN21997